MILTKMNYFHQSFIINKKTKILFMRDKKTPESSLLTLEVKNGRLIQYKGSFNRKPNPKEMAAINLYAKKHNLRIA